MATNYEEAVKWYRKAAEQGHAESQGRLGECYARGMGVGTNFTEAVKWYRRAAEQGHAKAQNWLGWCYKNGKGVKVDLAESAKWYRKAAEQGIVEAKCEVKRVEKRPKSGSSLRARRLQRQREAGAAGEKQCEEQSTKKSERQAQAEREKRQLEAEKEGRRQRLLTIQEELKKVREAKARAEAR